MSTQSTILAVGTTVGAVSDDVNLDDGVSAIVGIFVSANSVPRDCIYEIEQDTPGVDKIQGRLSGEGDGEVRLTGPGTWRFTRLSAGADGVSSGLFLEE